LHRLAPEIALLLHCREWPHGSGEPTFCSLNVLDALVDLR
jgi:hypothetical protein